MPAAPPAGRAAPPRPAARSRRAARTRRRARRRARRSARAACPARSPCRGRRWRPGRTAPPPRPCSASSAGPCRPRCLKPRIMSQSWRRDCGSSPVVGSSRNSRSGSPTSAQATASRCFCPPDSLPYQASRLSRARRWRAARRRSAPARRTTGTAAAISPTVSFSLSCVSCSGMPRRCRSRVASRSPSAGRAPRPRRRPAVEQPLEDLDRRGLAGAVGAEQPEALARDAPPGRGRRRPARRRSA